MIYLAGKFQCKDTWELIDSYDCTRPLAELVKWSNGWTIEILVRQLTLEAETVVLDYISANARGGDADELHVIGEPEPEPKSEPETLPVWLL